MIVQNAKAFVTKTLISTKVKDTYCRLIDMIQTKDPNKKHYFQVAADDEFTQCMLMQCSSEDSSHLTVWEKGENEEEAETYEAIEYIAHSKIIKLRPMGKLMTKITGSTKASKQVLVRIPVDDKINYFTGGFLKFHPEDLSYSIEIQQEIYKSQARGNFRLNSSEVIPIQFKIDEQIFDSLDVSISGTSFILEASEAERFSKGNLFKDCTLRFDRKNYHIPIAQIVAHIPMSDGRIKFGVSFKDVPKKTEDELYIKISTEARGEEMKKKFDIILSKKS